ncbi:MAG TPA: hypothetical protein IGS52_07640 [Oscillatoriaceae cyanobacterium M33_DOE_052]|nr:hypothetical protein [Oscillatoriaceae cyanobacterium M33_DOE_052]
MPQPPRTNRQVSKDDRPLYSEPLSRSIFVKGRYIWFEKVSNALIRR